MRKTNGRHAFMIITFRDIKVVSKFIDQIDDPRNDIFIHIDKKSQLTPEDFPRPKHARMKIYKKYLVVWGGSNIARTELYLLKKAYPHHYDYFHLCSEADMMIKTNDQFHDFFKANKGKEFIHFQDKSLRPEHLNRVEQYHPLTQLIYRFPSKKVRHHLIEADKKMVKLQKMVGFKRSHPFESLQKGCNWFSITSDLAAYVLANEKKLLKFIRGSFIPEESILQSLVQGTVFMDRLYDQNFDNNHLAAGRMLDWERGTPYVFRLEDFDLLVNSPGLIARKFSSDVDYEIVKKLNRYAKGE